MKFIFVSLEWQIGRQQSSVCQCAKLTWDLGACQNENYESPDCNRVREDERSQKEIFCWNRKNPIDWELLCLVGVYSAEGQSAEKSGLVAADG